MWVRKDIDIKLLEKYGFNCEDTDYIWNEEANISINLEDRSIFVYGSDEDSYQDLSILYRMFKDGILESLEVDYKDE